MKHKAKAGASFDAVAWTEANESVSAREARRARALLSPAERQAVGRVKARADCLVAAGKCREAAKVQLAKAEAYEAQAQALKD